MKTSPWGLGMRRQGSWHAICLLLIAMTVTWAHAQDNEQNRLSGFWEYQTMYSDVSGPGSSQSLLNEGFSFYSTLGLNQYGKLGEFDYFWNLELMATDNSNYDQEKFNVTNIQFGLSDDVMRLQLGDIYESFSQYSMSSAIKGGRFSYILNKEMENTITLFTGVAYPRWDNFLDGRETDSIKRSGTGLRYNQRLSDLQFGINAVTASDDGRLTTTDILYDNDVYSLDFEYNPMEEITLRGETAASHTTRHYSSSPHDTRDGDASFIEAILRSGQSRLSLMYEEVSSDFYTSMGAATPDRKKAKVDWRYYINRKLILLTKYLWYRDNLDGQLSDCTNHYRPEMGIIIRRPFGRRAAQLDATYKYDRAYGNNQSTINNIYTVAYRDRFDLIEMDTALEYTDFDTQTAIQDTNEITYRLDLHSRHNMGNLTCKPGVFMSTIRNYDDEASTVDTLTEHSLRLGLEAAQSKFTSDLRIGRKSMHRESATNSSREFASLGMYYRLDCLKPLLRFSLLQLRMDYNNLSFGTGGLDYREFTAQLGFRTEF